MLTILTVEMEHGEHYFTFLIVCIIMSCSFQQGLDAGDRMPRVFACELEKPSIAEVEMHNVYLFGPNLAIVTL